METIVVDHDEFITKCKNCMENFNIITNFFNSFKSYSTNTKVSIFIDISVLLFLISTIVYLWSIIVIVVTTVLSCSFTIVVYRFLVGHCFLQTQLKEVKTFSAASAKRYKESQKGDRYAIVVGFTVPNIIEYTDLLKILPRLVSAKVN